MFWSALPFGVMVVDKVVVGGDTRWLFSTNNTSFIHADLLGMRVRVQRRRSILLSIYFYDLLRIFV